MIAGIIFGVIYCVLSSIGQIIQKKGHLQAEREKKNFLFNLKWIFGQLLCLASVPINIIAISMTSQTALSMLPALSIIFVSIWSCLFLDTVFTKYEFFSLIFLVPGTTTIFFYSNIPKEKISTSELSEYVYSPESIFLICFVLCANLVFGVIVYYILHNFYAIKESIKQINMEIWAQSDRYTVESQSTTGPEVDILSYRWSIIPMIYFPFFASFFGTVSNTFVRAILINIYEEKAREEGEHGFGIFNLVLLILINISLMLMSLIYLNKSIQHFEPIYIIPQIKIWTLLNNIICGGIVFKEFKKYNYDMAVGIICGIILCFIGASFFVYKREGDFGYAYMTKDQPFSRCSYGSTDSSQYECEPTLDETKMAKTIKH